jgi:hypothetical protein
MEIPNRISRRAIRRIAEETMRGRGFAPQEMQVSDKAIEELQKYCHAFIVEIVNQSAADMIEHNNTQSYDQKKRITSEMVKSSIFLGVCQSLRNKGIRIQGNTLIVPICGD